MSTQQKTERVPVSTPVAPVIFSNLLEPRLNFKKDGYNFEVNLIFEGDEPEFLAFKAQMQAHAEKVRAELGLDPEEVRIKLPLKKATDKDGNPNGEIWLRVRGKADRKATEANPNPGMRKLKWFDGGRTLIENPSEPGNGSLLRMGVDMVANYISASDTVYISLYPVIVQVIKQVGSSADPDSYGMGELEGYEDLISDADVAADGNPDF